MTTTSVAIVLVVLSSASSTYSQWRPLPPLPIPIADAQRCYLQGRLYVFGGISIDPTGNVVYTRDVWSINQEGTDWQRIAEMPYPRSGGAAVTDGSKIYLVGGQWLDGSNAILTPQLLEFDPESVTFMSRSSMPDTLTFFYSTLIGENIYVMGGYGRQESGGWGYSSICQRYNIPSQTWHRLNDLPVAVANHAGGMTNDILYIVGGAHSQEQWLSNSAFEGQLVSVDSISWSPIADYPTAVVGAAGGFMDGQLIVAGGYVESGYSDKVFAYDSFTHAWAPLYSLPHAMSSPPILTVTSKGLVIIGGKENVGFSSRVYTLDSSRSDSEVDDQDTFRRLILGPSLSLNRILPP